MPVYRTISVVASRVALVTIFGLSQHFYSKLVMKLPFKAIRIVEHKPALELFIRLSNSK